MAAISKEVHAVCMGRHEITIPVDFVQMMSSTSIFTPPGLTKEGAAIDVMVRSARMDAGEFKQQVDKRHAEILAADEETTNVLKEVTTLSKEATIFRVNVVGHAYKDELHLWKGGTYVVATTESFYDSYKQAEARLGELAANVEVTARTPQPGFCLGPIVIKGKYVGEFGKLSFRSKATPDVVLAVSVDTYAANESKTLLQRVSGGDSLLSKLDAHPDVLKKGELEVAGMPAQQWLAAYRMGEGGKDKQFSFALETLRPRPAPLQPLIYIEFGTGKRGGDRSLPRSAWSDAEAIGLWDSIIKTIRVRPGN